MCMAYVTHNQNTKLILYEQNSYINIREYEQY